LKLVAQQSRAIDLAGQAVSYTLNRKLGRRGAGMKVDHAGLTVNTGVATPLHTIEDFIRANHAWVLAKLKAWEGKRSIAPTWRAGEQLPWLGGTVRLEVQQLAAGRARVLLNQDVLTVWATAEALPRVEALVVQFYKREARKHFSERTAAICAQYGIAPPKLLLTSAKGRWGSCNSKREMRINWRLMKAPLDEIDYVICHELSHLTHMNHSDAFWAVVAGMCPEWKRLRKQLNDRDFLYRAF
jgi:predicted metal-dependent hydrolase